MAAISQSRRRSRSVAVLLLFVILASVQGERVWFSDTDEVRVIDQDYESHNVFVVNGTTVSLENGSITAPDSGDDGEDAVRVVDATFHGISGKISGGLGLGGTGVTITTTRDSDEYPPGTATFEAGVEVYGGDATREKTTQGGNAVQILQSGSKAVINGGKFLPGRGCTIKVCGTVTSDGVALQVIQGEAIIKGGTFEGIINNFSGDVEFHGCVVYDKDSGKITGVLLDGSAIDVMYTSTEDPPSIVYERDACPQQAPAPMPENGGGRRMNPVVLMCVSVVLGNIITLQ
ncbi:hypothetical protein ACHAXR_013038 [Thalassiosira sp. AJA248-18]